MWPCPYWQASHLLLQEPVKLASILESSKEEMQVPSASATPPSSTTEAEGVFKHKFKSTPSSLTKIIGTLGNQSRSQDVLEELLTNGMSVARFDFSQGDTKYHQETLDNLKKAVKATRKLCAVMLDTVGPELQIMNSSENEISLVHGERVTLTPNLDAEASSNFLPTNFKGLADAVKPGDTIFVGQYLFTGSETTSVWLDVVETKDGDVICHIKNSAILTGSLFTAHAAEVKISMPTLSEADKKIISGWGGRNSIDFLSLSFTRHAEDVRTARSFLNSVGLAHTHIFAKVENTEGLVNFDEILAEANGIILSRGNLGIDLPAEKVFLLQKAALYKCNMAGKPAIVTRVVDSMTDTPRPTRAEATDIANAVLDGADGVMLGAETLRGLYPVETVGTVRRICQEAEKVYNHELFFKKTVKFVGEPMSHLESIASSAVRAATKVGAPTIVVFTTSGRAPRLIAKYRPSMPVLVVVIPRLTTNQLTWTFSGAYHSGSSSTTIRSFAHRDSAEDLTIAKDSSSVSFNRTGSGSLRGGLDYASSALGSDASGTGGSNESILTYALDAGKAAGIIKAGDQVVVMQKLGDHAVVKILDIER
eukprot:SM000002S05491  [mRNA]  locus=s2:37683:43916:- [translate_table: standard]